MVRVLPSQKWHNELRQLHFKSNVVQALLGTEAQRVHHHPPNVKLFCSAVTADVTLDLTSNAVAARNMPQSMCKVMFDTGREHKKAMPRS